MVCLVRYCAFGQWVRLIYGRFLKKLATDDSLKLLCT